MSKAGFDPRQSIQFWKKFALISKSQSAKLFSTHPSDESRIKNLEDKMQQAIEISNASKLKGINPSCRL
ncbi:MAG: M48 family metalloprotease, partial [Leptospiraceae bacterium]|nr:M48 family metalloprotease [Leptospiraceae bacterium]